MAIKVLANVADGVITIVVSDQTRLAMTMAEATELARDLLSTVNECKPRDERCNVSGTVYVLPWPPAVNHMWRRVGHLTILSKEARVFKEAVRNQFYGQKITPTVSDLCVTVRLYRPRRIGDIDGYLKSVFDSLNGILWVDDKQIVELHAFRFDDKNSPRVEIEIEDR